ncbi:serine/threonine-protein kinase [Mycolicibacterium mucogenicum]|uniref:serine/threonine-protein kinase n=1 Tax=Mycolicibacterium mucogenicum TaxID=56689 RepID=UPI00076AB76B|nr:serine/threonine-protein kinase [Mycolicibacterium mucogenicum]
MLLTEGQVFAGYTIRRKLGAGGMGSVYLASHPRLPRLDAVKVLSAELTSDPEYGPRFLREADLVSTLSHPNILGVHDRGECDGQLWISMDYVAGTDAAQLLREHYPAGMPPEVALPIIHAVASALDHAHRRGLLHRDVKPANILLDAETSRIYLADFGIARPMNDSAGLTATNMAVGTVAYAAPEQLRGEGMDGRTDQYALACTAFQLLTGNPPYADSNPAVVITKHVTAPAPSLGEHRPELRGLDPVLARAMSKTPAARFASCGEFAQALQQQSRQPMPMATNDFRNQQTMAAPAPPPSTRHAPQPLNLPPQQFTSPPPRSSRSGALIAVLAVVALLVVAGVVFAGVQLFGGGDHLIGTPPTHTMSPSAAGTGFSGRYRAEYGPATDLQGTAIPGGPAITGQWDVRSSCGANGCIANASYTGKSAVPVVSNMTFDQISGDWVAVGTGAVKCTDAPGEAPTEVWVVFTLTPKPDGTLAGETTRSAVNGCSSVKRTVTFTRTGDGELSSVSDPAGLPPRTTSPASTLHGRYHENIVYAVGGFGPGAPDLEVRTQCLRTGDRCISAFHAMDGVVTLIFAAGKWTRTEEGTVPCALGGTTHVKITAEYPLPTDLQDPIPTLEGRGTNTSTGGECKGGDFTDKFVRTGD